ncbi:acetyl-CoA carboxylase biotin carboxyl carrier protein subunit [Mesobacillus maritimus]|uniref:acetyl-CoA carboxylase biotin carboxyl carrier protein subunit n=1 Tax=Mesobacillus maritimus TaxID=1643336 RepID=UPI00203E8191|nr:acetyl-CoA carboxylase biotin carboxyl carrier protein subunit [Mesobacillus maritimus]MCM3584182.1 acetyl-CoA carboxylase biotin carboxyl carrier protein subunit [Mesobacillus maritimus]MCM3669356.1 acetyl-CoA carboxylase biotin carboxyl carrier protein subunit [Mesobacillus maritimus]
MVEVLASMSGNVWKIEVKENDVVKEGDVLIILESMKMEIPIEATHDGVVTAIQTAEGEFVQEGDVLVTINNE